MLQTATFKCNLQNSAIVLDLGYAWQLNLTTFIENRQRTDVASLWNCQTRKTCWKPFRRMFLLFVCRLFACLRLHWGRFCAVGELEWLIWRKTSHKYWTCCCGKNKKKDILSNATAIQGCVPVNFFHECTSSLHCTNFRPRSHRTRNQVCTQICMQTLWCCLQAVWTLPLTTMCSKICVCLLWGALRPVWTGP